MAMPAGTWFKTFVMAGALAAPAAGQAQPPQGTATQPAATERLADLIRLWTVVRLFHVDERAMTAEWERALEEAAGPALAAVDDAAFGAVANRMMSRIQAPPGTVRNAPAPAEQAAPADEPPFRLVDGRAVASCRAIGTAIVSGGQPQPAADVLAAIRATGIILDCRNFSFDKTGAGERFAFSQWFSNSAPRLFPKGIDRGLIRSRFHDGFPPDTGQSSGGYARGTVDVAIGRVEPSGGAQARAPRIAIIADASLPDPWMMAGGLREAGLGGLVAQGPLHEEGLYPFMGKHFRGGVKVTAYVGPDGAAGFRPAACVAAGAADEGMRAARAVLDGGTAPPCPAARQMAPEVPSSPASAPPSAREAAPSLGERMVALAKLWGTIEYFFPYRHLADRPWSAALEEFIPVFDAAETREAYEDAVMRMAQRLDDSHVGVSGMRAHPLSSLGALPLYIRPVEKGFAVAGLHDPELADRLRIGDEILSVDGRPVAEIAAGLRPYLATSTPQSLASRVAGRLTAGQADSDVRLSLRRGNAAPFEVILKRLARSAFPAGKPATTQPSFRRLEGDIGYIDLERLQREDADRAIDALMDTKAIVFDLRGYPQGTAWLLAPRLALHGREGAVAASFRRPTYRGPSEPQQRWTTFEQTIPTGDKPRYRGRIVVLIDDRAISQSEHTALFFKAAAKPVFVGTATTGANGDVTRVALPGGLVVGFTGHDVAHPDGRRLQRVGIQPDLVVVPTFAGMRAGRDEVLEAGLKVARRR